MRRCLSFVFASSLLWCAPGAGGDTAKQSAAKQAAAKQAAVKQAAAKQAALDEQTLKSANIKADNESLLDLFRRRTLDEGARGVVQGLIRRLGSEVYRQREQAAVELISRGPAVIEALREALKSPDLEVVRRAERCLHRIQDMDYSVEVPAAAARLLAVRKPPRTIETLVAYVPFADNDTVADEVRNTLAALAVKDGKADAVLVSALEDKSAVRRATAGEALIKAAVKDLKPAVRKLLGDPEPIVRLRIAMALTFARERDAVPVLIDVLPRLTLVQAWQAEDILYRLASGHNPPHVSLGNDEATRKKCRDAWAAWWKASEAKVDLAHLQETPRLLGYTLVALLDEGQVIELGPQKQRRWAVDNLAFPLDIQALPNGNVLIAEYHASRVAERNPKGEIVWEKRVLGPLVGQRLRNGNTFIATDSVLIEVDRNGKEASPPITLPGEKIMKAMKTQSGEIACLTSESRVVRLDATGKELHTFPVSLGMRLYGGRIDVLPNGHVLIPHNAESKVVEYNGAGKAVWEIGVEQPIAATRLPNGNTLVTSMLPARGAMEFDRRGNVVWQFTANTRVTRALRR
jgi:HEAT repeat protein